MAALATTNAYTSVFTSNAKGVAFQIAGTFVGTVAFQGSIDGTNFVPMNMIPLNSATPATNATSVNVFMAPIYGLSEVRAVMTAWTSGSALVVGKTTR